MSHSAKAQLFRRTLNAAREANLPNLPALPEAAQDVWNEFSGGVASNSNSSNTQQQTQGFRLHGSGFGRQSLGSGAANGTSLPRPPMQQTFTAYPPRTQPPAGLQGTLRGSTTPYSHLDLGLNRPTSGIPVLWQQRQQQPGGARAPATAASAGAAALPPPPPPPPRSAGTAGSQHGLEVVAVVAGPGSQQTGVLGSRGTAVISSSTFKAPVVGAAAPAGSTAVGASAGSESASRHLAAIAAALSPPGAQPTSAAAAAVALVAPTQPTAQQLLVSHVQQVHAAFAAQQKQQTGGATSSALPSTTAHGAIANSMSSTTGMSSASATSSTLSAAASRPAAGQAQGQGLRGSANWDMQANVARGQTQPSTGKQAHLKRPRSAADFAARDGFNTNATQSGVGGGSLHGGSGMSSVALNRLIMGAASTADLLSVVRAHGQHFDFFNISSAIARVPKLVAAQGGGHNGGSHSNMDDGGHHARGSYNGSFSGVQQQVHFGSEHRSVTSITADDHSHAHSQQQHAVPFHHGSGHGAGPHLDPPGRALVASLARLMANRIESFDARGLANSAWALGKLRDGSLGPLVGKETLRRLNGPGRGGFSAQNLANLVWSFVYMGHRDEALLQVMAEQVVERVHEFKPQELANILWSYASLDFHHERMVAKVSSRMVEMGGVFKEQELANALWALAKLHTRGGGGNSAASTVAFNALLGQAKVQLHQFMPQGISNTVWAMAAIGHRDSGMLQRVVEHCQGQLGAFDVQALANLAWSLATLGFHDARFMNSLLRECTNRLHLLSPQNVSNTLWACATLGHVDDRMLNTWSRHVGERASAFEPQGLSNSAWALAKLGVREAALWEAVAAAAMPKLALFTPQGLANLSWAFATAQYAHPALFEAIAARSQLQLSSFNAQNCGVLAWSFGTARHYHPALLDGLAARLANQLSAATAAAADGTCEPQHLAHAMWAFARFNHSLGSAGPVLQQACVAFLPRMAQQDVCGSLSALASLQLLNRDTFDRYSQRLARASDLSAEELQQVYHAQLLLHADAQLAGRHALSSLHLPSAADLGFGSNSSNSSHNGSLTGSLSGLDNWLASAPRKLPAVNSQRPLAEPLQGNTATGYGRSRALNVAAEEVKSLQPAQPTLPPQLQAAAASAWLSNPGSGSGASLLSPAHLEVAAALAVVGVPAALNSWTEDGQLSVGLAVQVLAADGRAHPVALEVVGPQDLTSNQPSMALGDVQARRRLLEARGWQVVNVDAFEWNSGGCSQPSLSQERAEQLLCRIADAICVQPANWQQVTMPGAVTAAGNWQQVSVAGPSASSWIENVSSDSATAAAGSNSVVGGSSGWLQQTGVLQAQDTDTLPEEALELAGSWYGGQAYTESFNLGAQTNVHLPGVTAGDWGRQADTQQQQRRQQQVLQTAAMQQQAHHQEEQRYVPHEHQFAQSRAQGVDHLQQLQQPAAIQQGSWDLSPSINVPFTSSSSGRGGHDAQHPQPARRSSPVSWADADAADEWQALSWQAGGSGLLGAGAAATTADSSASGHLLNFLHAAHVEQSSATANLRHFQAPLLGMAGCDIDASNHNSGLALFSSMQNVLSGSGGGNSVPWGPVTGQVGMDAPTWGQLPVLQRAGSLTSCDSSDPDLLLLGRHEAAVAALIQ